MVLVSTSCNVNPYITVTSRSPYRHHDLMVSLSCVVMSALHCTPSCTAYRTIMTYWIFFVWWLLLLVVWIWFTGYYGNQCAHESWLIYGMTLTRHANFPALRLHIQVSLMECGVSFNRHQWKNTWRNFPRHQYTNSNELSAVAMRTL